MTTSLAALALASAAAALTPACGGGGGSSPDARTIDAIVPDAFHPDGPPDVITIAITAPHGGDVVVGSRTITVTGTLASAATITDVELAVGGAAPIAATSFDQTSFTGTVTLGDGTQTITVTAHDTSAGSGSAEVAARYPFVAITDFMAATHVQGQPVFVTGAQRAPDAASLANPVGDAAQIGSALFVPALSDNRVLVWKVVPTSDGAAADFALGQADLTSSIAATSATGLRQPTSVATDGTHVVVVDHANNRVLIWNVVPNDFAAAADVALGQPDLVTATGGCAAGALRGPTDAVIAGTKLIVADTNNSRVLVWNTIPTASGAAPDLVLGQGDLTHCVGNDDNQDNVIDAAPSARTVRGPLGVWSDGTRLVVSDSSNNRVLIWSTFPTASFATADLVLGQPDFVTGTTAATGATTVTPQLVTSNGNQLVVADTNANRVLVWSPLPTTSNAPADHVLGQGDFTHAAPNDDNQDGAKDALPSARTLQTPRGVAFVGDTLVVSDAGNHRALVFGP